jgi:hypothetical protein
MEQQQGVINNATNKLNVELIATFYDVNNVTLGSDSTFTNHTTLEEGQSAPFDLIQ